MREEQLQVVEDFVSGLLKKANVSHAGNCLVMSEVLQEYLAIFMGIEAGLVNVKVKQGKRNVNHYCLQLPDGNILDATSSQFQDMPKIYYGQMPTSYQYHKLLP